MGHRGSAVVLAGLHTPQGWRCSQSRVAPNNLPSRSSWNALEDFLLHIMPSTSSRLPIARMDAVFNPHAVPFHDFSSAIAMHTRLLLQCQAVPPTDGNQAILAPSAGDTGALAAELAETVLASASWFQAYHFMQCAVGLAACGFQHVSSCAVFWAWAMQWISAGMLFTLVKVFDGGAAYLLKALKSLLVGCTRAAGDTDLDVGATSAHAGVRPPSEKGSI